MENKWLLECEKVTKVMIGIILCTLTKNNAAAIIINLFVSCMTYNSYCWIFVSCIRYFEFYDLIASSVVMCVLS